MKRIYDKAYELLSDIGSDEFIDEYGPYRKKTEIYCSDCASYIDIPEDVYNKYHMILSIVHNQINGASRFVWLDHLDKIYKSSSNSWYSFYRDKPSDACDKYCKSRW